jgi:glucuronoarabinoxylan endo-1,4-beta-xylanase
MAIDTTATSYNLKMKLPYKVKGGTHVLSTGNETNELCQELPLTFEEPAENIVLDMPARSLNTYILLIDNGAAAIEEVSHADDSTVKAYYDLHGRLLESPRGLCIVKYADGSSKKVFVKD